MNEKRISKQALLAIFLIVIVSSCHQMPSSCDRGVVSDVVEKDAVWTDLRIQELLPGYMVFPGIEPYLPEQFVALRDPKDWSEVYWGDREVLETYFEKGISHLKSAVIRVNISPNVAQINENSFSDEGSDWESQGIKNCIVNKWKWGINPVMSMEGIIGDAKAHAAWIGLCHNGQVLFAALIYPLNQNVPSAEDLTMWSDFLKKTTPLKEPEFYKVHGQDLREGFTLVNVYGSVLKVSAEKRIRDGKIQINIQPADKTISCKCFSVDQMLMPVKWHFFEPIVKIQSEIQVSSDANLRSEQTITVLLKKVSEFSNHEEGHTSDSFSRSEYGNVSILNFCAQDILRVSQ